MLCTYLVVLSCHGVVVGYDHNMEVHMSNVRWTAEQVMAAIEAQCIPEPNSGCMIFLGNISKRSDGDKRPLYGSVRADGRMKRVHRVVFENTYGPIPDGLHILHRCDVSLCCNPSHLSMGTNTDNHRDKATKDCGRKRLTQAMAAETRELAKCGVSQGPLARRFSVNQSTISRILSGKRRSAVLPSV